MCVCVCGYEYCHVFRRMAYSGDTFRHGQHRPFFQCNFAQHSLLYLTSISILSTYLLLALIFMSCPSLTPFKFNVLYLSFLHLLIFHLFSLLKIPFVFAFFVILVHLAARIVAVLSVSDHVQLSLPFPISFSTVSGIHRRLCCPSIFVIF